MTGPDKTPRRRWTATRVGAVLAASMLECSLGWLLIDGLRARFFQAPTEATLTVTEIAVPTTPPPPRPPPKPVPKPAGAAAPAATRAPRTEPSPRVALASPTPAAAAAGEAPAGSRSGSGAGGQGEGAGAGTGGGGSGSGVAVPPQRIAGALSDRDYPRDADRASGTVGIGFMVRSDGRVDGCRVLGSSGSPRLDGLTCTLVTQRFRYRPAINGAGQAIDAPVRTAFTWGTR